MLTPTGFVEEPDPFSEHDTFSGAEIVETAFVFPSSLLSSEVAAIFSSA
jgi:hypothetical protein